jgi:hypothetical protein
VEVKKKFRDFDGFKIFQALQIGEHGSENANFLSTFTYVYKVNGRGGPWDCDTSTLPHFVDIGSQMAVNFLALCAGCHLPQGNFLNIYFC